MKLFRYAAALLAVIIFFICICSMQVHALWPADSDLVDQVYTVSDAVMMVDADMGLVFYEKNIHERIYPASTIKLLTCLLAAENSSPDDIVTVSKTAVALPPDYTCMPLYEGEKMTMRELMYGMMVRSANDCANAIAEHVGGSIQKFVKMMNDKAAELGCRESHFTNPYGYYEADHYSTAFDMAIIASAAFKNPTVAKMAHTTEYYFKKTNKSPERYWASSNGLINPDNYYYHPNVIGSKAGNVDSGFCLVTMANFGFRNVVVVCMQAHSGAGIYDDTTRLLDFLKDNIVEQKPTFFSDVKDSSASYFSPVYWAQANKIAAGYDDGTFRPENGCTREQFAVMLWRMCGKPEYRDYLASSFTEGGQSGSMEEWIRNEASHSSFTDLNSESSGYKAIHWLEVMGIFGYLENDTFRPQEELTCGEAIYILWSLMGCPEVSGDSRSEDEYLDSGYNPAIIWAADSNLIPENDHDSFITESICSRWQAVTILYRLFRKGYF